MSWLIDTYLIRSGWIRRFYSYFSGEERNLPLCSTADGNYDKLFSIPENSRDGT